MSTPTLDAEYRKVITARYLDKPCWTCGGALVQGDYAATNDFKAWHSYCTRCANSFSAQVAALLDRATAACNTIGEANVSPEVASIARTAEPLIEQVIVHRSPDPKIFLSAKSALFSMLVALDKAVKQASATPDPLIDALRAIAATGDRDSGFAGSLVGGYEKWGSLTANQRDAAERMITKRSLKAQQVAQQPVYAQRPQPFTIPEVGLYRDDDGTVRRVYRTSSRRNRIACRRYNSNVFVNEGSIGLRKVAEGLDAGTVRLLTMAEASAFGKQIGRCFNCMSIGRPGHLSDDRSLSVGYGPDCAGHNGWWYPTNDEAAQILRGTLDLDDKLSQALASGAALPQAPTADEAEVIREAILEGEDLDTALNGEELSDEDLFVDESPFAPVTREQVEASPVLAALSPEAREQVAQQAEAATAVTVATEAPVRPSEASNLCARCNEAPATISVVCEHAEAHRVCGPCRRLVVSQGCGIEHS